MNLINGETIINNSFSIREFASRRIYRCKERAYGKGTDASNVLEGDYGEWGEWEDVLVEFATFILLNSKAQGAGDTKGE